jgi:hypothetical protein
MKQKYVMEMMAEGRKVRGVLRKFVDEASETVEMCISRKVEIGVAEGREASRTLIGIHNQIGQIAAIQG